MNIQKSKIIITFLFIISPFVVEKIMSLLILNIILLLKYYKKIMRLGNKKERPGED